MQNITPKHYLALLHNIWFSQRLLLSLFSSDNNYQYVYDNLSYNLLETYWLRKKQIEYILQNKNKINLEYIEKKLLERNTKIVCYTDRNYPSELKNISNPPFLLYVRWNISSWPKFAIIWSRSTSSYANRVISNIVPDLCKYFTIVSWWAMWCDSMSHISALSNNWSTISVIWTWINIDYPLNNKQLYDDIVKSNWAIISIFPFSEVWNPYNFPIRNEIVSWLCKWILVVEAKEKSWSLITSKLALEQWKDVFAIPGDIFRTTSLWCNRLILNWEAKIVISSEDILNEYNINTRNIKTEKNIISFDDEIEKEIFDKLTIDSLSASKLSQVLNIDIQTIGFKLSMLEIKWYIRKSSWANYILN